MRATLLLTVIAGASWAPAASAQSRKVAVVPVGREHIERWIPLVGEVFPDQQADIVPQVSGYLKSVAVEEGDVVVAGAELAVVDVPELVAEVAVAKAKVAEAESMVEDARGLVTMRQADVAVREAETEACAAELELQDKIVARLESLVERKVAEYQELEQAQGKRAMVEAQGRKASAMVAGAQAALSAARASQSAKEQMVQTARAEAELANARFGFAQLVCPFAKGLVTQRHVDAGALVEAGGAPVVTVMDVSRLRVRVEVPERELPNVGPETPVTIQLDADAEAEFEGTVTFLAGALDPRTRRMRAWVLLEDPDPRIRPGMWCKVRMNTVSRTDAMVLPGGAVRLDDRQPYVLVVQDGKVTRKDVTLGVDDGSKTEVLTGLEGGEQVIVGNIAGLLEGDAVEAVE